MGVKTLLIYEVSLRSSYQHKYCQACCHYFPRKEDKKVKKKNKKDKKENMENQQLLYNQEIWVVQLKHLKRSDGDEREE